MLSPERLQLLSDEMTRQYKSGEMNCYQVVGVLFSLKLANAITAPTMRTIIEEIVRRREIKGALAYTIVAAQDKKYMAGLEDLARRWAVSRTYDYDYFPDTDS